MARVLNSAKEADGLERSITPEDIERRVKCLAHADPRQDWIIAEVDGTAVAYGDTDWSLEVPEVWVFMQTGWVDPGWRRKGIGRSILRWQERRMKAASDAIRDDRPRYLQGWASETRVSKKSLFLSEGYEPFGYVAEMIRPDLEEIPEARLPEGIEVRPVEEGHLRAIVDAENEAFRDHVGHREYREAEFQVITSGPTYDPTLWRVAWEGDEVAGMVRGFINEKENTEFGRRRGYPEHISVRRPWRRRGLARTLLVMTLDALKERGMEEAALDVHMENPHEALRLYESVGFTVRETFGWYRKSCP
jgi:ribosomal protein S18 acetylase RimI-like enzyme